MMAAIGRTQFEQLLRHKVTLEELKNIMLAYEHAKSAHDGQVRDGGGPFFEHPKCAALILIQEFGIYDADMIIAELLHDTLEESYVFGGDNETHIERLSMFFNDRVARLVREVTKDKELTAEQKRQYALRIAACGEEDVQILKLADRLHNLRTLEGCAPEKQARVLQETLEIYLPCAERLGGLIYEKLAAEREALTKRLSESAAPQETAQG